jgi:hypothetical protein
MDQRARVGYERRIDEGVGAGLEEEGKVGSFVCLFASPAYGPSLVRMDAFPD